MQDGIRKNTNLCGKGETRWVITKKDLLTTNGADSYLEL